LASHIINVPRLVGGELDRAIFAPQMARGGHKKKAPPKQGQFIVEPPAPDRQYR
jgi:hypothetical protein